MKSDSADRASPNRVLLMLPTRRDALLTADCLGRDGIATHVCHDTQELAEELVRGAGAVLVAEEALACGALAVLARAVARQPRWSDLPVLVLSRDGGNSRLIRDAMEQLGNVMLLDRPLRLAALTSNVGTALRARARQYQISNHLHDLAHARDALAEVARRKDEFLAMLGHELRNPLAPIRNALHLLGGTTADTDPHHPLYAMMTRQVDHMVRLVDDLIDVSRISRGTVTLRREPIDLAMALRSAVDLSGPLIETGEHRLQLQVPDEPLRIDADPVRITQVFGNLLNNAAKYSPRAGSIAIEVRREDTDVVVSVRDCGIGIEPEMLPHVFELFTQGRRDAHRAHDGLGIGLTLVRSIVELHGGTVSAHSDGQGHGSRFVVRLPLLRAVDRNAAPSPPEPAAPPGEGVPPLRVLVVDDNEDSASSMGMVLELLGLDHEIAFSGAAALQTAARFRPHVVLLDIGMPGMDGYEVARRLRGDAELDGTGMTLIALTGWSQVQDLQRSRDAGFDHHFSKPVDIGALQSVLARLRPAVAA